MKRCAFTGHRPKSFLWGYDESATDCVLLKRVLSEQIKALTDQGVTDFLSGMAQGVDLWSSQIVLDLKRKNPVLKLHCVLPHEGQADKWSDSAQERYHTILAQADSVEYVSRTYYDGCMIDRNHRLIEAAEVLLAVYNGAQRSGTGATINYARKMGRKIIIIDPATLHITYEYPTYPCPADWT